jgi:hypothetical protein
MPVKSEYKFTDALATICAKVQAKSDPERLARIRRLDYSKSTPLVYPWRQRTGPAPFDRGRKMNRAIDNAWRERAARHQWGDHV